MPATGLSYLIATVRPCNSVLPAYNSQCKCECKQNVRVFRPVPVCVSCVSIYPHMSRSTAALADWHGFVLLPCLLRSLRFALHCSLFSDSLAAFPASLALTHIYIMEMMPTPPMGSDQFRPANERRTSSLAAVSLLFARYVTALSVKSRSGSLLHNMSRAAAEAPGPKLRQRATTLLPAAGVPCTTMAIEKNERR